MFPFPFRLADEYGAFHDNDTSFLVPNLDIDYCFFLAIKQTILFAGHLLPDYDLLDRSLLFYLIHIGRVILRINWFSDC
ncbi:MAG: hypothetical protein ACI94Y_004513 [Maribacter sp.]|jgi:hypothetical protein